MLGNSAPRRRPLWPAGIVLFAASACNAQDADWSKLRARMVDEHTAQGFNLQPQEISRLEQESGEKNLRGRTGGAVTLALGIARIFDGIPGLRGLMKLLKNSLVP